jgi:hypothetical protein
VFDAAILDVAIGLVLIYLTLGLVCTAISEVINSLLSLRANNLRDALENLLGSKETAAAFYDRPLIRTLRREGSLPSYIPTWVFSRALVDQALGGPSAPQSVDALRDRLRDPTASGLPALQRDALLSVLDESVTTLDDARAAIGWWFDDAMERASGWYRRRIQGWTLLASACLVVLLDVDTLEIAQATWTNDELRASLVQRAERVHEESALGGRQIRMQAEDIAREIQELRDGHMPLGWTNADLRRLFPEGNPTGAALAWIGKLAGLLASAFAVSLGAPFWFDLLNRLTKARTATSSRGASEPSA